MFALSNMWVRRYDICLFALGVGGVTGGWVVRNAWFPIPGHAYLNNYLLDFSWTPLSTILLLGVSQQVVRGWRRLGSSSSEPNDPAPAYWPPVTAGLAWAVQELIEFRQRTGWLRVRPDHAHWWKGALNWASDHLGHTFDWHDVAAIACGGVIAVFCVTRSRQVRERAGILPAW